MAEKEEIVHRLKAFASTCDAFDRCRTEMLIESLRFKNEKLPSFILDIGCGVGGTIPYLKRRCPATIVVGLDSSYNALMVAKRVSGKHAEFVRGDAQNLPFRSEVFDGVIAGEVIEHLPNDFALLIEAYRVMKPCGVLALSTPNGRKLDQDDRRYGHLRIYSDNKLRGMLQSAGFLEVKVRKWGSILLRLYFKTRETMLRCAGWDMFISEGREEAAIAMNKSKIFRLYTRLLPMFSRILRLDRAPAGGLARHLIVRAIRNDAPWIEEKNP